MDIIRIIVVYYIRHVSAHRIFLVLTSLVLGVVLALIIAPENNIKYYGLTSVERSIEEGLQPDSGISVQDSDVSFVMPAVNESDSGVARLKYLRFSFQAILQSPVVGVGVKEWVYDSPHPHNVVVETALMFGVPAAVALLLFYMATLKFLADLVPKISLLNELWLMSLIALLLYMLFYNLVQGQLASFRSLPLFLLSGLGAGYYARVPRHGCVLPVGSSLEQGQQTQDRHLGKSLEASRVRDQRPDG